MLIFLAELTFVPASGIKNLTIIQFPSNFNAGDNASLIFSFEYPEISTNEDNSSLILKITIESLDKDYPVWKNDFYLGGFVVQNFIFSSKKISHLKCLESNVNFDYKNKTVHNEKSPNGSFYCFDPNDYMTFLKVNTNEEVFIQINSSPNLYPGKYKISIDLLELKKDFNTPKIKIKSEDKSSDRRLKVEVVDEGNIENSNVKYKIIINGNDSGWVQDFTYNAESNLYESKFDMSSLDNLSLYSLQIEAEDAWGNIGNLTISKDNEKSDKQQQPNSAGGGGGSINSPNDYVKTSGKFYLIEGKNEIQKNIDYLFNINNKENSLRILKINANSATFYIREILNFELFLDQIRHIDIDKDGKEDTTIKLISIENNRSVIEFYALKEDSENSEIAERINLIEPDESFERDESFLNNYSKPIAGGAIALVTISGVLLYMRRRRNKKNLNFR